MPTSPALERHRRQKTPMPLKAPAGPSTALEKNEWDSITPKARSS